MDGDSISTFASKKVEHQNKNQHFETQSATNNTPKKEESTNSNFEPNSETNIISSSMKDDDRNFIKTKGLQTRESVGQEDSKTPRVVVSELGNPL